MGTTVNLPAGVLRSSFSMASALRVGQLGDDTASLLAVLKTANQASAFKSQDLDAAIDSWHKATDKEKASAQIAAILESRAKELAPIVEEASKNFLGTVRFASHEKLVAEINEALKAPAVPVVDLGGAFMEVRRIPGVYLQETEELINRKMDEIASMWFRSRRYKAVERFLEDLRTRIKTVEHKEDGRTLQKALANTRDIIEKQGSPSSKMQIDNILGMPDDDIAAFGIFLNREMKPIGLIRR